MKLLLLLIPALLFLMARSAIGQVIDVGPFVTIVEGPVKGLSRNPDGTLQMTVMGVPVIIKNTTRVHSPSSLLSFAQLMNITKMPGRLQRGFMNGTALVRGSQDALGVMTAVDVSLQPAENVVVGMVTKNSGGQLLVNQMPVKFLNDARMPGRGAMNAFAIPVDLNSVMAGTTCSLEGYFDDSGTFQSANLYLDTNAPPLSTAPQVAFIVVRATERQPNIQKGDDYDIRGGVTFFHAGGATTQSISVYRVDNGLRTFLGSTTATRNPLFPNYGLWQLKGSTPASADPVLGNAPTVIRAVMTSPGANSASTEDIVDVR